MTATDEMCRVSICTSDHEVDVTLPAHVPIAELMPALLDLVGGGGFAGEPCLTRVGGEVLDTAETLAHGAITDGDLLILTSAAARPMPPPRFDVSTAVTDAVADLTRPPWPAAGRVARSIVLCWAAAQLLAVLGCPTLGPGATRHIAIGATAALLAVAGAVAVRQDRIQCATLGVLAAVFAGLTATLASPGHPGIAGFLLAMSACSATALLMWRILDCAPSVFLPLGATTMATAAATVGAVAGWWALTAAGPMLATASLTILALSTRLSVRSTGLSTPGLSASELDATTRTAHHRLTVLTVTAAAGAALGVVITAATAARPIAAAGLLIVVGAALLLNTRRRTDPYHVVALLLSAGVVMTSLILLCAATTPASTPWLCGALMAVGIAAVWFGRGTRWRLSPAARRAIAILDLAVGAAVVPTAAGAAGVFATLPGIGHP
ncbi:type VII secretion integral membrane protein EccD [Mycolicibacterium sarraceniae]|uniref:ESX-4 secretion system protein eccD4 n=1 Tax=Mycolicibacterium sarraceniae TaxID=1534348 RepID=A0A7I7SNT0_9MYCO|nr:type VII secretion integral membrane protein EccD [Mycolicibacterium sarraceniae]BBY57496.1 ESX-4 secretion system protein eccD4 [Mycolicibacterium sarraceniae]